MDHRTRFMNCLKGLPIDRLPFIEFHGMPWCYGHPQRWDMEGIAYGSEPRLAFGFDCVDAPAAAVKGFEAAPVDWYAVPRLPEYQLPDEGPYKRRIDGRWGQIRKDVPPNHPNRPIEVRIFEKPLVKTEEDWLAYKERLRPSPEGRYPADWDRWVAHSETVAWPIALNLPGFFGTLTTVIGLEEPTGLFMSFHDRPDFVRSIVAHLIEWVIGVSEKALREARIDFAILGEQIAGDDGPMIGPGLVQEFFLNGYKRVIDHVRSCGVETVIYNSDGNVGAFMDLLTGIGIDGVMTIPKQMDAHGLRARYGNELALIGGVDRWALVKSKQDIKREVDEVMELARRGRFIPCLCGGVLPETALENYRYYAEYLRQRIMESEIVSATDGETWH